MRQSGWKGGSPSVITLADQARDAGQWELAARNYQTALSRNPQRPAIWIQYGHVLKESGHLAQAEKAYRAAIAYDRRTADAYLHLGHVLKLQDRHEGAQAAYLQALALDPSLDGAALELAALGWSKAHVAQLQAMTGYNDASAEPDVNGTGPQVSASASSVGLKRTQPVRSRSGAVRRARLRS